MSSDSRPSRRDLLRGWFDRRQASAPEFAPLEKKTSAGKRRFALPIHRPPGAVDEASFLAGCTRCNDCIRACPYEAIVPAPAKFREAAGTPMIDAATTACAFCEDVPCIRACKPGVLRFDQPRKMGVAWIQPEACLAHIGTLCTVCSERCPVPMAIAVMQGKPRIREELCTGCGVCGNVCPAPVNAIVLMPLADRPAISIPGKSAELGSAAQNAASVGGSEE